MNVQFYANLKVLLAFDSKYNIEFNWIKTILQASKGEIGLTQKRFNSINILDSSSRMKEM